MQRRFRRREAIVVQPFRTLLIANRSEIALRVQRAAALLGTRTAGVRAADEPTTGHTASCDVAAELPGSGASAYLDVAAVIETARAVGADAVHPGYGFLSESPDLAAACTEAGLVFVGPDVGALRTFGHKTEARALADRLGVPVLPAAGAVDEQQVRDFLDALEPDPSRGTGSAVLKAVGGGGGRAMRVLRGGDGIPTALAAARAEADASGAGELYVERLLTGARHVEIQLAGDGDRVVALSDRDCSLQRRHQKLVEVAPCPDLRPELRRQIHQAAVRLAEHVGYRGLATAEFLVRGDEFFFLEVNPRLQVEHTVTEEVLGLDLVRTQLQLAAGAGLDELGLDPQDPPRPRGCAVQIRVNTETTAADGTTLPSSGTLRELQLPTGRGVRVDTAAHVGQHIGTAYDPLLAKIVVHDAAGFEPARLLARRAVDETRVRGVRTNLVLQRKLLRSNDFAANRCTTSYVDEHIDELADAEERPAETADGAVRAPVSGSVVAIDVVEGQQVAAGTVLALVEAMKMQHEVRAEHPGTVTAIAVRPGDVVPAGSAVVHLTGTGRTDGRGNTETEPDPEHIREDLARVRARKHLLTDEARPESTARRHGRGMRTARENIADLVDPGSFHEYGGLAIAAQRSRRDLEDLQVNTPADGMVTGLGRINGTSADPQRSTCAVLAYDYTVLAGTQGYFNHRKTDRILEVARRGSHPVVLFAEGGGGRPGDVDVPKVGGLNTPSFVALGELSGRVPTIGVAAGRCFAGNAAMLGSCDVVIATRDANIGMGGPAMIEGGGLGTFAPEEIGPIDVQTANGVVDVAVDDESAAVDVAKRYLSYFQGDAPDFEEPDQRRLRHVVPQDRKRGYDVRAAVDLLCDTGSVLELRPEFGRCAVTALVRIGGRPMGLIANNPRVLGGAIDADGADKLTRMLSLCEVFGLPVVSLCDTPGFMVGPESEKSATVRHFGRMFVRGSQLTVPVATVVLRKSYGLGAMAMAGGTMTAPVVTASWPSGEVGGMGLEGAVQLGFRRELEAIADPAARQRRYDELVAQMYEAGGALNTAVHLEIDDVIDPAGTRSLLLSAIPQVRREGWTNPRARAVVDAW